MIIANEIFVDVDFYEHYCRPGYYALIISMAGVTGSDTPLGHTPEGGACSRLVILFHWSQARIINKNV